MSGPAEVLAGLGEETSRLGLRWYVFGAQAVAAHGVPRATQDVDVTVLADIATARRLIDALRGQVIVHRFPEIADELLLRAHVAPLVHPGTGFEIDLVLGGTELEEVAAGRAESLVIAGVPVPVSGPTDLAISKMIAGRALDHQDVRGGEPTAAALAASVIAAAPRVAGVTGRGGACGQDSERLPAIGTAGCRAMR